jgi:chromosome segregation ATPase
MTDNEALGLLNRLDTEREQFKNLWDQLTPSYRKLKELIEHCQSVQQRRDILADQLRQLLDDIAKAQPEFDALKVRLKKEESELRAALTADTAKVRGETTAAITKLAQVTKDSKEAEQRAQDRLKNVNDAIALRETELKRIQDELEAFRKRVGA